MLPRDAVGPDVPDPDVPDRGVPDRGDLPVIDLDAVGAAWLAGQVRSGALDRAAEGASSLPATVVDAGLAQAALDGWGAQAALVAAARGRPAVLAALALVRRASWRVAASVVVVLGTLVVVGGAWPLLLFAPVPGMATRLLAAELVMRTRGRELLADAPAPVGDRAQLLVDCTVYRTGGERAFGRVDAVVLVAGGAALYVLAAYVQVQGGGGSVAVALAATGALMAAAGAMAVGATRRLHAAGLLGRPPGHRPPERLRSDRRFQLVALVAAATFLVLAVALLAGLTLTSRQLVVDRADMTGAEAASVGLADARRGRAIDVCPSLASAVLERPNGRCRPALEDEGVPVGVVLAAVALLVVVVVALARSRRRLRRELDLVRPPPPGG